MTAAVDTTTAADVAAYVDQLVSDTFITENTERQADRDPTRMSMSWIGGCTRAAAYSLAGTPATNVHPPEEARAAVLGTWMHDALFPRMGRVAGGALIEQPVTLTAGGVTLRGSFDIVLLRRLGSPYNLLGEGKSVNHWRMQGVLRHDSAYNAHWLQAVSYGWACYQGGEDVDWVTWLYLHRERGEVSRYVSRLNKFATTAVEERLREVAYWAENPGKAPREIATVGGRHREYATLRGPGLSPACDHCPWLRECWPGAVPGQVGAQTVLAENAAGIEKALELYEAGRVKASEGDADKKFAAAILANTKPGPYGKLIYGHGTGAIKDDQVAIKERLAELGALTDDVQALLHRLDELGEALPDDMRTRLLRLVELGSQDIPKKRSAAPIVVKRAAQVA